MLVNGVIQACDTGGQGEPIVLLHGGWTDSRIWAELVNFLPPARRVISYDARGYGRSALPTDPFTELEDVLTILDQLEISSALLVGHSGGGATALSLAVTRPELVTGLVLLAPGVSDYPWPLADHYFTDFEAGYAAGDRAALVELGLRTWAPGDFSIETRAMLHDAVDSMFKRGDMCQPDPPVLGHLTEVEVPTTLIIGRQDHPSVISCSAAIADRIPNCRVSAPAHVDHLLPLRIPDAIALAIAGHDA
jgi:3-oxoadipate enol-lactonase